jgi:tetratricopeptide (TPR) repeat protein
MAPEAPPQAPARPETPDQARLRDALTGQQLPPGEVADLSDRLLTAGNEVSDQDMARLELVLLKAIKSPDKTHQAVFWRNLGIIHYSQRKYKQARQELQYANELNPKNARTRYYLARLFVNQGEIFEKQGKKNLARQQFKRAAIEMEMARKIEPSNPLYRQDVKQLIGRQ